RRVDEIDGQVGDERGDDDAAGDHPHVAERRVAPPAVVEARGDEDDQLERDDEEDRPAEQVRIRDVEPVIEAELEREPPRRRDDRRVHEELPDAVRREEAAHRQIPLATPTAERTTSTTRSCASFLITGQTATEKFSAPTCSVTGSEPRS